MVSVNFFLFQRFRSAQRPMLIVGSELLQRMDGSTLLSAVMGIADSVEQPLPTEEWKVLNVLQKVGG